MSEEATSLTSRLIVAGSTVVALSLLSPGIAQAGEPACGRDDRGRLLGVESGLVRSYRVCFAVVAASFLIWLVATEYRLLVVFAIVLGIGYGGCIALNPAVLAQMFGVDRLGGLVGLMYTSAGIGTLIGPLAAGFLIDVTGTYRWAIAGCFILATAAALALIPLRPSGPVRSRAA